MKLQKKMIAVAVAAGIAGIAVQAHAGTASSTFNTYATEQATIGLGDVANPATSYQLGILAAAGTTFVLYVAPENGAKFGTGAIATTDVTIAGKTVTTDYTVNSVTYSTSKKVMAVEITAVNPLTNADVITIASVAAALNLADADVLKTAGGAVNVQFGIQNGPFTGSGDFAFPTSTVDSASGIFANAADAITYRVVPSNAYDGDADVDPTPAPTNDNETDRIDVAQNLEFFTGIGDDTVNLGAVFFEDAGGTQLNATAADFTLAGDVTEFSFDVAADFPSDLDGTNSMLGLFTDNCATAVGTATATYASDAKTGTIKFGGPPVSGTPYYICLMVSGDVEIPETTPSLTSGKLLNGTNTAKSLDTTDLYPLLKNGDSQDFINYVPAAAAPYQTYFRIHNDGAVTADVSVEYFDSTNGNSLGKGVVATGLGNNEGLTVSPSAAEAAAGVSLTATDRPWVRISGPTDDLDIQSFLADPNGGFTNMTMER